MGDIQEQQNSTGTQIEMRSPRFNEEKFMAFVAEEIDKYKRHAEIVKNPDNISLSDLNHALAEYSTVRATLISIHAIAQTETRKYKEQFEDWFSEKYVLIRNRENPKNSPAAKWAGQKEIERIIRYEFPFEFKALKELMDMSGLREAFLERMIESWSNHQFILNQISKNIQTEVMIGNTRLSREFE
jgi:hypothetical protein